MEREKSGQVKGRKIEVGQLTLGDFWMPQGDLRLQKLPKI